MHGAGSHRAVLRAAFAMLLLGLALLAWLLWRGRPRVTFAGRSDRRRS